MDDATLKIVERVEKLLRLAAKNPNQAEAASATAKAQELLAAYNLDMATIEANSGQTSGKRLDEQVTGGMYKYQRNLWRSLAELNFCMYWTQVVRIRPSDPRWNNGKRKLSYEHRLVGRQVNVVTTQNMARYLNQTIERLCRERLSDRGEGNSQFFTQWAVSFREGIADAVIEKITERRADLIQAEKRKARAAAVAASKAGVSTATALTLGSVAEREEQANYDFINGEGAWAAREARRAKREKEWVKRRQEEAKALAEAERVYAAWAKAHPEEAAAEERKARARQRAKDRAAERRRPRDYYFRQTPEELRAGTSAYHAGREVGARVGIDPQTDDGRKRGIGHG